MLRLCPGSLRTNSLIASCIPLTIKDWLIVVAAVLDQPVSPETADTSIALGPVVGSSIDCLITAVIELGSSLLRLILAIVLVLRDLGAYKYEAETPIIAEANKVELGSPLKLTQWCVLYM